MKKTKKQAKLLIVIILFSMLAMYGYMPDARAASITNARDLLSDSDIGVISGNHFTFTTSVPLVVTDRIDVVFPNDGNPFGSMATAPTICPAGTASSSPDAFTLRCTVGGGGLAAGTYNIFATTTNPATQAFNPGKTIEIVSSNSSNVVKEHVYVMVAIVSSVTVTAKVTDTLNFIITGLATSTLVNGVPTTGSTSPSYIPYNTLVVGASSTLGQQLQVTTNADDGYSVTVEQDHELLSNSGSNINSFDNSPDNTGSTSPHTWVNPAGILDAYNTYGHMGITSDDADLNTAGHNGGGFPLGADFTGSKYAGLNGTSTMIIMAHEGPADGNTQNKGLAKVAYSILITAMQEAGDYSNTLTYICTPQF
jgi:hypothetical protein